MKMTQLYMGDNFCTIYKLAFHRLQKFLVANGYKLATTSQEADVLVAGVCASFEADEAMAQVLLDKFTRTGKPLYIIGCMVRVKPDKMPVSNLFYSWEYERLAKELVPEPSVAWEDIALPSGFRCREDYRIYNPQKQFVGLCFGCAFDCSYCSHKLGAGGLVSRSEEDILNQIRGLLHQNVSTIVLTGIDTASYGKEIGTSFPELLERIILSTDRWVNYHIAQFNPEGIDSKATREQMVRLCSLPYVTELQLPIQTTSSRLLRLMNRNYDIKNVTEFIDHVRRGNSKLYWRTDLLVGFPTETMVELEDSAEFAIQYFDEVAVYGYEYKPGSPIDKMSLPRLDANVIDQRKQKAIRRLSDAGLLVHSGGQDTQSLLKVDEFKEQK